MKNFVFFSFLIFLIFPIISNESSQNSPDDNDLTLTTAVTTPPLLSSSQVTPPSYYHPQKSPTTKTTPTTPSYFLLSTSDETNITAQAGSTVFMPCRIRKGVINKSVTFLRTRDGHILTVDRYLFISDSRFSLLPPAPSSVQQTFTLVIKPVLPRDAGPYECQIPTSPNKHSLIFNLTVVRPTVKILLSGGDSSSTDIFIKGGSSLNIKCVIYDAMEMPDYIFWYKDGGRLVSGGRVRMGVERMLAEGVIVASLGVDRVESGNTTFGGVISKGDGGNYSCDVGGIYFQGDEDYEQKNNWVVVHVLSGEHPASAMQQNNNRLPGNDNKLVTQSNSHRNFHSNEDIIIVILTIVGAFISY